MYMLFLVKGKQYIYTSPIMYWQVRAEGVSYLHYLLFIAFVTGISFTFLTRRWCKLKNGERLTTRLYGGCVQGKPGPV